MSAPAAASLTALLFLICFLPVQRIGSRSGLQLVLAAALLLIIGGLVRLALGPGGLADLGAIMLALLAVVVGMALFFAWLTRVMVLRVGGERRRAATVAATAAGTLGFALVVLLVWNAL